MAVAKGYTGFQARPSSFIALRATTRGSSACISCKRPFATSQVSFAGHNKWSKTKHIKAVTDKKKMADRTSFTRIIAMYSKMYGEDVRFNPQLANAIAAATKASVPKALVEAAIARGQGRSVSGTQLESMTLEILMPPDVALIADIETDNKSRTLHDLKYVVKKAGGVVGSTAFNFSRRGRVVLKSSQSPRPTLSDILEEMLEHEGAEDAETLSNASFVVWTQPAQAMVITKALSDRFGLEVVDTDIIWAANEEATIRIDSEQHAKSLSSLLAGLREYTEVKAMFTNARPGRISADEWEPVERHIDT